MEEQLNCFQELTLTDGTPSETKYKEYYAKQLEISNQFQDFVCINLIKKGIVLSNMSSRKYQMDLGENIQGFEIKFDHLFRKTGNLYIEIMEKSNSSLEFYSDSGINRHDNTWIYCVGDYEGIFLMQKSVLVAMNEKGSFKFVENGTKTSKGFLLPVTDAKKYFTEISFIS